MLVKEISRNALRQNVRIIDCPTEEPSSLWSRQLLDEKDKCSVFAEVSEAADELDVRHHLGSPRKQDCTTPKHSLRGRTNTNSALTDHVVLFR